MLPPPPNHGVCGPSSFPKTPNYCLSRVRIPLPSSPSFLSLLVNLNPLKLGQDFIRHAWPAPHLKECSQIGFHVFFFFKSNLILFVCVICLGYNRRGETPIVRPEGHQEIILILGLTSGERGSCGIRVYFSFIHYKENLIFYRFVVDLS